MASLGVALVLPVPEAGPGHARSLAWLFALAARKGGTVIMDPPDSLCCTAKNQAAACPPTGLKEDGVRNTA